MNIYYWLWFVTESPWITISIGDLVGFTTVIPHCSPRLWVNPQFFHHFYGLIPHFSPLLWLKSHGPKQFWSPFPRLITFTQTTVQLPKIHVQPSQTWRQNHCEMLKSLRCWAMVPKLVKYEVSNFMYIYYVYSGSLWLIFGTHFGCWVCIPS